MAKLMKAPCPFCGGNANAVWNAVVTVRNGSGTHQETGVCIYCENCPVEIRTTMKHLAFEMWNRRYVEPDTVEHALDILRASGWKKERP